MEDILLKDCTPNIDHNPEENSWSVLEQIAREGARRLLQQTLEKEVEEYLNLHQSFRNEEDRQSVVRNGYMPERAHHRYGSNQDKTTQSG